VPLTGRRRDPFPVSTIISGVDIRNGRSLCRSFPKGGDRAASTMICRTMNLPPTFNHSFNGHRQEQAKSTTSQCGHVPGVDVSIDPTTNLSSESHFDIPTSATTGRSTPISTGKQLLKTKNLKHPF
jgi:hypothetical protein